jgi:hypothetical protein
MSKKFRIYDKIAKDLNPIYDCYAEVTIGINDGDLEDPDSLRDSIDCGEIMHDFLEARCHRGDLHLSIELSPVTFYHRNYSTNKNSARRGIKLFCRLGECELDRSINEQVDENEYFFHLWRDCFIELVESTMTYLGQDQAIVYINGGGRNQAIPIESYWDPTAK